MPAFSAKPLLVRNPREDTAGAVEDIIRWTRQGEEGAAFPLGRVASGSSSAATNSGVSGTNGDVGLSATFTALPKRLYKVTAYVPRMNAPSVLILDAIFTDGANTFLAYAGTVSFLAASNQPLCAVTYLSGISGSYTVKLRATSSTASAVTFQFGGYTSTIVVEDVGLA